jgi:hypothetical protein
MGVFFEFNRIGGPVAQNLRDFEQKVKKMGTPEGMPKLRFE